MAKIEPEFTRRHAKLIGLSVDPVDSHSRWLDDIEETQGAKVNYPIIADSDLKVAKLYNMLPGRGAGHVGGPHRGDEPDGALGLHHRPRQEDQADADLPDDDGPQLRRDSARARFDAAHREAQGRDARPTGSRATTSSLRARSPTRTPRRCSRPAGRRRSLICASSSSRAERSRSTFEKEGPMGARILVLGAGFGGLELSSILSEAPRARKVEITIIDKGDAFVFGYSKLDVMFGRTTLDAVRLPYANVRQARRAAPAGDDRRHRSGRPPGRPPTWASTIATFSSSRSAPTTTSRRRRDWTPRTSSTRSPGRARSARSCRVSRRAARSSASAARPTNARPAPSECALLLHDFLTRQGVRGQCDITMVLPLPSPVPPSPDTSKALIAAFAERDITFMPNRRVAAVDAGRRVATLDDGGSLPYDLFLGVPKHRAPAVVETSGMAEGGWVPVNPRTLETKYPNVYAIGDIANTGTPKAGVFAEGAAKAVASSLVSPHLRQGRKPSLRRRRVLLHRVWRRTRRPRRRRFLLRAEADRDVPRAERGAARGQGRVRIGAARRAGSAL